jgi:capsular polysaccharide transport system ATP-binding protein
VIVLEGVRKAFTIRGRTKVVADGIDATFPSRVSVGLMGRNGAGKSTLMEMIGGRMKPDSGRIRITGTVSWPVGFAGNFNRDMTGAQNVRFAARLYGIETEALIDYVRDFAELGPHFEAPLRTYSSGMRSRLAFGISMGVPFDTYLVDEVTSVGDASFKAKSLAVFRERMGRAGAILVSHSMGQMRRFCDAGAVLVDGRLSYFDDVEDAIAYHREVNGPGPGPGRAMDAGDDD